MSTVLWPTTWWQRHFGRPPAPTIGQVWRSAHSGKSVRVANVEVGDTGVLHVDLAAYPASGPVPPMAMTYYLVGSNWAHLLRSERRELVRA